MKFKLPILEEEMDIESGNVKSTKKYIDCEFNYTIDAQQTWEDTFPEQAKNIGLFDFVEKFKGVKVENQATALATLKIIYCFILFDREMPFRQFARLFSSANIEYTTELYDILGKVIKAITNESESKKKD